MQNPTMPNPKPTSFYFCTILLVLILRNVGPVSSKSTIEPCSASDSCPALVGYTLYTDLKVAELAALFQVDPISLLAANSIDFYTSDIQHRILPSGIFLKIPVSCSCSGGIRKALINYVSGSSDDLNDVASSVYGGLVTTDQIKAASNISTDGVGIGGGTNLTIPLPCTCFGLKDNSLPTIYLSYLVREGETLKGIAGRYSITLTDIMNVNGLRTDAIDPEDILAVPLPACASNFVKYASDNGLVVANGSYAITAGHCVQCSCGPANLNLYCVPSSLAVSCSSMQCRNSNLALGNVTTELGGGGCKLTSCSYNGFVNNSIWMTLSNSLRPRCPAAQTLPPLVEPSSLHALPPSPSSPEPGGPAGAPRSLALPPSRSVPGFTPLPVSGPSGSFSVAYSLNPSANLPVIILCWFSKVAMSLLL